MSLAESQEFFFELCSDPRTIRKFKKNRKQVLSHFFKSKKDRSYMESYAIERFETYRNHISYGILAGVQSAFPVLRSLVSERQWNQLLNEFYLKRQTKSPIARHAYFEFAQYLQNYTGPLLKKMPYLKELADYESLDIKLFFEKDKKSNAKLITCIDAKKILTLKPILNPNIAIRKYRWPVHKICNSYSDAKKIKRGEYLLIVYRDPETLEVRFIEGSPSLEELIKLMATKTASRSIQDILKVLLKKSRATLMTEELKKCFLEEAILALSYLKDRKIILGYSSLSVSNKFSTH